MADPSLYPPVCRLITAICSKYPNETAIEDGEEQITYRELDYASSRFAARLVEKGVKPGDPVPVLSTLCIPLFVGILGILKIGAVYVPSDLSQWSEKHISTVLRSVNGTLLVYTGAKCQWEGYDSVGVTVSGDNAGGDDVSRWTGTSESTELACIIFTSGTTGKQKGVMIRNEALTNFVRSRGLFMDVGPGSRFLLILSIAFDACNGYMMSVLCGGGTLVLATAYNFQDRLRTCTIVAATPSILGSIEAPRGGNDSYPNLKSIILGGETAPQWLLSAWNSPAWTIYNDYGPTEATCAVLTNAFKISDSDNSFESSAFGAPISGAQVALLDERLCEISEPEEGEGEIVISGVCLARGYWRDKARTNEKFICWKGRQIYRTGDYGRWRLSSFGQKVLEFRGRRDRVVKNRGFLVNLEVDVDAAILEAGSCITAAYSVMHAGRLHIVVVPRTIDTGVLREMLALRLACYQVPDHIVAVDTLPKGTNGKIDPHGILKIIAATSTRDAEEKDAGETVESIVRSGMACVLDLPKATIQLDSDFVRLGGHSLAAVALASYCRQHGAIITTYDILTTRTVADLVERGRRCSGKLVVCPEPNMAVETGPITDVQLSLIHGSVNTPGTNVIQATIVYPTEVIPDLMKAWKAVIRDEPIFRTTFDVARRQQTVHTEAVFVWEEVTVDTEDEYERELHNAPFDIGLATRFKVVTLGRRQSALIWIVHHALIDGYSASLVMNKVQAMANGSSAKAGPPFTQLARELECLQKKLELEAKSFWKQEEEDLPNAIGQIVLPQPCDADATIRFAEVRLATGLSLESITQHTKTLGVTSSVLFYAAWAILISNYANSEQVVMGAVMSGRDLPLPSAAAAIGPLVSTLPLRIHVDPSCTAADFQRLVFMKMHQIGRFKWYLGEGARYSSVLATQYDIPKRNYEFASPIKPPIIIERPDFPLSLLVEEDMTIRFLYHSNHYRKLDIERMSENYRNILHALLIPGTDVDTCSRKMLSPIARNDLLLKGNALSSFTFATESSENVVTMFEHIAERDPQVIAVEKGTRSLTYQELDTAATKLAGKILCSVQAGDVVCLHADHSINWIVGILGILKAGATYCPLDEIQPVELRADMYTRSKATLFLAPSYHQIKDSPKTASCHLAIDLSLRAVEADNRCHKYVPPNPNTIAYICFTSGSTGKPKGVLCEHGGLIAFQKSWSKITDSTRGQRFAQFLSAGFDGSILEIFGALCHGLTLVLRDSQDPFAVLKTVDMAVMTPSAAEGLNPHDYKNLSQLFLAGEAVFQRVADRWAPGRLLYNVYGPTEATVLTTVARLYAGSAVTVGFPLPSVRVYILNDKMDFTPVGVVGEIYIAGVQVSQGYIGMEEETKRGFQRDIIISRTSERMYRTGDLGYWSENGEVVCMGRKDRQVKLRGFRLDLNNIESTIVREIIDITAAVVTVSCGSLIAWVQPASTDISTLKNRLANILPPYARPKSITAVESFPLTKNGKLDYMTIAKSVNPTILGKRKRESPRGRTELIIAQEWRSLLGFEELETISPEDNFVELGGHSVLQLVLAARLSQLFSLSIPVSTVINSYSLRKLACAVDSLIKVDGNNVKRMEDAPQLGHDNLSPAEMDWWLKYSSAQERSTFNVPFACNLSDAVDRTLLARAWKVVISRHILLRCQFVVIDGKPRRIFSDKVPVVSLLGKLDVWREINRPIDLGTDDLIRVLISPRQMLVVVSHIVCDLTALNVLLKEVGTVYARSSLPDIKTTYMEVTMWSKRASASDLEFWSAYLRGGPQSLPHQASQIAVSRDSCCNKSYRGTSRISNFGQALYRSIMAVAKNHGTTLHQLSRAAVVLVLQSLTETKDIVVGSPFMNRPSIEDQEVVGLFLEPIPMRFRFDGEDIPCASIVNAVQNSSQSALAHAVPWNDLLQHLGVDGSYPIFDTVVTFHSEIVGGKELLIPGVEPFMVWTEGSKFKLLFEWTALASSETLVMRLEYDTDRLSAECIEIVEEALRKCLVCFISDKSYQEIRREIGDVAKEMCKEKFIDINCLASLGYTR